MAQLSEFKFLFAIKFNLNGGPFSLRNVKIWIFQKVEKNQHKIRVAEKIGCKYYIFLSKIGQGQKNIGKTYNVI